MIKPSPLYHYHKKKGIIVTLNSKGKVRPGKENSSEEHGERRKSDSVINELKLNPGESGGKIRREKKVSETNVENIKKQPFFFMQERVGLKLLFMLTSQ